MHLETAPAPAVTTTARFLEAVERGLDDILQERAPGATLYRAARQLCFASGAKRARPLLASLLGRAAGAPEGAMVEVALAAELIHTGSLLHDDVLDHGVERRGQPTAHSLFGATQAVLAGDLLLSLAIARLAERAPAAAGPAARCLAEMSQAASEEVRLRGSVDVDEELWRMIAAGKTGALFAFIGRAAGALVGDAHLADRLAAAGEHLGVAFQIADDMADIEGGQGKDRGKDLLEQNPNLVVVLATRSDPALRGALEDLWASDARAKEDFATVLERLRDHAAMSEAQERLAREVAALETNLAELPHPSSAPFIAGFGRGLLEFGLVGASRALMKALR